jgi:hypothetical protein
MPAAEDIPVASSAITETPAMQRSYTRTAKRQPTTLPPRIIANLMPLQRITANPTPTLTLLPLTLPPLIIASPTPPRRLVAGLTVEAGNLTVEAENLTVEVADLTVEAEKLTVEAENTTNQ